MVAYQLNTSTDLEVLEHLLDCDADFVERLSDRVTISDYAQKIENEAIRFEAWAEGKLVGLVAAYCNDVSTRVAFITNVSVSKAYECQGIALNLMNHCLAHARESNMREVKLEVAFDNAPAIRLYERCGFVKHAPCAQTITMNLFFDPQEQHEKRA